TNRAGVVKEPGDGSGEIDIANHPCLTGPGDELNQRVAFGDARPPPKQQNDSMVRHGRRESQEVLRIARHQHQFLARRVGEDHLIRAVRRECLPQSDDGMTQAFQREPTAVRNVLVDKEGLLRLWRRLSSHQQVNLAAVILIIGEAFIHLSPRKIGETMLAHDAVHSLAVLEQADHVVDTDARALHAGGAAAYATRPDNVAVGGRQ
ncbi:MAG TPA: hypothetical protein VMH39_05970, partial [Gemmatimonadaceae bacterium]|nr:hypothetical protein [Gemmatimonadaceae bacterium]